MSILPYHSDFDVLNFYGLSQASFADPNNEASPMRPNPGRERGPDSAEAMYMARQTFFYSTDTTSVDYSTRYGSSFRDNILAGAIAHEF